MFLFETNNFCLKHFCLPRLVFEILGCHLKWDTLYIKQAKKTMKRKYEIRINFFFTWAKCEYSSYLNSSVRETLAKVRSRKRLLKWTKFTDFLLIDVILDLLLISTECFLLAAFFIIWQWVWECSPRIN